MQVRKTIGLAWVYDCIDMVIMMGDIMGYGDNDEREKASEKLREIFIHGSINLQPYFERAIRP